MTTKDYFYNLPEELIAQTPAEPRDSSRLLIYNRETGHVEHKHFYDITQYLQKGDLLVVNKTKVLPVRLFGHREKTGGKVELLLLKRLDTFRWEALAKPGRGTKEGDRIVISDKLTAEIKDIIEEGVRIVHFYFEGRFEELLDSLGEMPLPPYIKKKLDNPDRYNTVYSKEPGSAAAPTAGLHFTQRLISELSKKGVEFAEVVLDVGLGTFRPVKEEDLTKHKMHVEHYSIDAFNAEKINRARKEGRRIIAVGTTVVRVLESVADDNGYVKEAKGDTDIFIYPPYKFKAIDALITNFHLPESTLLMLVSALCGRDKIMDLYNLAVKEQYRFFSFGDAMFIF
jgi:S-adenosylmethionine:tRNA ribosyltransferase-isomerase